MKLSLTHIKVWIGETQPGIHKVITSHDERRRRLFKSRYKLEVIPPDRNEGKRDGQ